MITLSFDSTAKIASVAICDDDKLLSLYNIDNGLTQSELLLPMAESALKALRLTFDDIGLLCASVGPGSFTGVRIGTALVKGIAFGRSIPCASVSTVEALAENTNGFNCSDITNLLDRIEEISIIRGIKTGEKYIADEDFATALTEIHSSVQADDIVKLREWREGNDQ